jgi:diaminopimelate epimerase
MFGLERLGNPQRLALLRRLRYNGANRMEIQFIKLQSCGADFIVLDALKNAGLRPEHLPDLSAQICSRHFGVGAMGVALVRKNAGARLGIACFSPQGSEAGADPLAVRCVARYAFDAGLAGSETFTVELSGAATTVEVLDAHNITLPSGPPTYWDRNDSLRERSAETFTRTLRLMDRELNYTPVRLDGLQAVFFPGGSPLALSEFGREVEAAGAFAGGINLVFARLISREELSLRIWRVQGGEQLAAEGCAGSAVVASVLNGFGDRQALVHLEGGNLFVDWSEEDNRLYVSGGAEYVFMGTYYYEEGEADEE